MHTMPTFPYYNGNFMDEKTMAKAVRMLSSSVRLQEIVNLDSRKHL